MIYENILITGCGGDIGLTLGDIAKTENAAAGVFGCDMTTGHPGASVFDACDIVPRADDAGYLDALERIADRRRIDAIVPMSEAEIARLAQDGSLEKFRGRDVIAANPKAVETGLDKFNTYRMLIDAGLTAPWTILVGEGDPKAFPCIVKPRRGQGGKGLRRVENAAVAADIAPSHTGFIWQELILPDDAEYTCGLYRDNNGETRTLIFRRQLQGDITKMAEVVENEAVDTLLHGIADAIGLRGAVNVQLRIDDQGPKVFEINPRFSSTVGFRHRLGFRDFIWSLAERRQQPLEPYRPPLTGTKVFRGISLFVTPP